MTTEAGASTKLVCLSVNYEGKNIHSSVTKECRVADRFPKESDLAKCEKDTCIKNWFYVKDKADTFGKCKD